GAPLGERGDQEPARGGAPRATITKLGDELLDRATHAAKDSLGPVPSPGRSTWFLVAVACWSRFDTLGRLLTLKEHEEDAGGRNPVSLDPDPQLADSTGVAARRRDGRVHHRPVHRWVGRVH